MKKALVLYALVCLYCWSLALADDSDMFGISVQPNVLILFDSSQSMDATIHSSSYNPATSYAGGYTSTVVYQRISSGYYVIQE